MQYKEYHFMDEEKKSWGEGPWMLEPDKIQFQDTATKLPCLIRRSGTTGALCGYVGVTEGHPLYMEGYQKADYNIVVHGGITYTAFCPDDADESTDICHLPDEGEPHKVWWLGFDCSHGFDLSPAMHARMKDIGAHAASDLYKGVYRDVAYVTEQIISLAEQLKAMEHG